MINYFQIRLFLISSSILYIALLIRLNFTAFSICLICLIMHSIISVVFVQKMVQQVIFSHKLTNIALIITFNYQSDLTDYSVLVIYLIADMNIWISMENRNTYINLQYVILILATILKVIATDNLNDNIFMVLVVGVYLLTLIPF